MFLEWRSCLSKAHEGADPLIPSSLFAASPPNLKTRLPFEVALLLPIQKVSDPVPQNAANLSQIAAALFMANPLLNVATWSRHLLDRGVGWISNFPSVAQHEPLFRDHLSDVGLGPAQERELLSEFRAAGLRTLVCVSQDDDAQAAVSAGHDALLILPQVPAFEAGFPSVQHRQEQLLSIRSAIKDATTPVLGLLQPAEAAMPTTWPNGMDAGMIRPTASSLAQV